MNDFLMDFIKYSKEKLGYEIVVTEAIGENAFDWIFGEDFSSGSTYSTELNGTFEYKNDSVSFSLESEYGVNECEIGQALVA